MKKPLRLEKQEPITPLDEATKAAIEAGLAAARRGEVVTLEQSDRDLEKGYQAWLESQKAALPV